MRLQTIKQQAEMDCYICCVAMALNLTYDQFCIRIGQNLVEKIQKQGTWTEEISWIWSCLGMVENQDYYKVYRQKPLQIDDLWYGSSIAFCKEILKGRRALIQVASLNRDGSSHLVYWDGDSLHDPSNKKTYTWEMVKPLWITIFNEELLRTKWPQN